MISVEKCIYEIEFRFPGIATCPATSDEWQTLKTAVLAQQSTNKQSTPCEHDMVAVSEYRCNKCGWVSSTCYE